MRLATSHCDAGRRFVTARELTTARLRLRAWRPEDAAPLAAINRDPEVTRYVARPPDARAIAAFYDEVTAHWRNHGFGLWAVTLRSGAQRGRLIGFVGPSYPTFIPELGGQPELGWRLARDVWGLGLATEAARAARDDALDRLAVRSLISIIHPDNQRSIGVARKLGMQRSARVHNPVTGQDVDVWHTAADHRHA